MSIHLMSLIPSFWQTPSFYELNITCFKIFNDIIKFCAKDLSNYCLAPSQSGLLNQDVLNNQI